MFQGEGPLLESHCVLTAFCERRPGHPSCPRHTRHGHAACPAQRQLGMATTLLLVERGKRLCGHAILEIARPRHTPLRKQLPRRGPRRG